MNLFQNRATPFFLHKGATPRREGTFDVILSPQFYWVKRVSLPVKRLSDAKRLAESVFEGSLPKGSYSYEVSKVDNGDFILIAYDREAISDVLKHYFTDRAKVQSLYFAQHACADIESCCSVDEKSSLVNLNALLMQIPRNCTDPKLTMEAYLKEAKLQGPKVKLGSLEREVVDRKTFILLAASILLFVVALGIEYVDYKTQSARLQEARDALVAKYDLPPTTMQLESIKNRLFKTFQKQKRIRDVLSGLSKVALLKGEYIHSLEIDDKAATVAFEIQNPEREAALKSQLSKKFKILASTLNGKRLQIKIAV